MKPKEKIKELEQNLKKLQDKHNLICNKLILAKERLQQAFDLAVKIRCDAWSGQRTISNADKLREILATTESHIDI